MNSKTIALAAALIMVASAFAQKTYTVRKGDTLAKVAAKTGAKIDLLAKKNGLRKHSMLIIGRKLRLPDSPESYTKPPATLKTVSSSALPGGVTISKQNVNIRKKPTLKSAVVAKVAEGATATVLSKAQGFYKVKFPGGTVGFVRWDMVKPTAKALKVNYISTPTAKVNKDGVNVRQAPTTTSKSLAVVAKGTAAKILDRRGQWYKLKFPKGTIGYIRGDLLNASGRALSGGTRRNTVIYASKSGKNLPASSYAIVQNAKEMLGTPYVFASQSSRGVDCSGLVYYLYRKTEGITLPRTSRSQSTYGAKVAKDDLRPGDLLFFNSSRRGRVNHAAIYIGGGKYIHASSSRGSVVVSSTGSSYFQRNFAVARRPQPNLKTAKTSSSNKSSTKSSSSKKKAASN